jgi:hypothetical protein
MEAIRDLIEWVANDSGSTLATLFPYLLLGLAGLWLLWMVVGYLRVSQVGIEERAPSSHANTPPESGPAPESLPESGTDAAPRGVPYCAFDRLAYPPGARFCTVCERDLTIDCTNCGATLPASEASCYRCGTPTTPAETPLLT